MSEKLAQLKKKGGGGKLDFDNAVIGTITPSTAGTTTVNLGFKPKIVVLFGKYGPYQYEHICNVLLDDNLYQTSVDSATGAAFAFELNAFPNANPNRIGNVTNTGFVINTCSSAKVSTYIAVK